MAGFSAGNLGGAMQQFGQALGGLGQTIYDVEAQNQERQAKIDAAAEVEKFKESLWQDPDYGTPGQNDGYMKKWNEFIQGTKERAGLKSTIPGGLTNAKAKDAVGAWIDQMAIQQGAEVSALQFKSWAEGTVAKSDKRVNDLLDKGGIDAQTKLDAAHAEISYQREHNLISQAQYESKMETSSQIAIRRDLTDRAKEAYKAGGIVAATRAIETDQTSYTAGGSTFFAGEQVKKLAASDIALYDESVQKSYDTEMEKLYASYAAVLAGSPYYKDGDPVLSITAIQGWKDPDGAQADEAHQLAWLGRLAGLDAQHKTGSGSSDEDIGKTIVDQIDKIDGALRLVAGGQLAPDANISIAYVDPKTGKWSSRDVKVTRELRDTYTKEFTHYIDASRSWDHVMKSALDLSKPMGNWEYWQSKNLDKLKKMPNGGEIIAQMKYLASAPGSSEYTPDLIDKTMKSLMDGVQVKTFKDSFNYEFGRLDSFDTYCQDIEDGKLKHVMVRDSENNWKAGLSSYQDPIQRNSGAIALRLEGLGTGKLSFRLGENARPWYQAEKPEAQPGLPKGYGKPASVSYTTATYGDQRQGVFLQDINYPGAGGHVKQVYVPDAGAKKPGWITVKQVGGIYYPDPDALKAMSDRQAAYAADQAKIKAKADQDQRFVLWRAAQVEAGNYNAMKTSLEDWIKAGEP